MCQASVGNRPLSRVQGRQPPGRRRGWGTRAVGLSLALGRTRGAEDVLLLGSVWSEGPGEGLTGRVCPRGDCAGLSSWAVGWSQGHLPGRVGSSWGIEGFLGLPGEARCYREAVSKAWVRDAVEAGGWGGGEPGRDK